MPAVLVVDDDVDTRSNLTDILSEFGYEVETAGSGEAALELLRVKSYDVALLDLKLPGIDGVTLSQKIRDENGDIVSIIVTGYAGEDTERRARDSGVWRVLSKPVNPRALLEHLDSLVHLPLVLIVDDDRDLRDALWDLLRSEGYRVAQAGNCQEARKRLERQDYQIVLLDLKLPGGDGVAVFEDLQRLSPETKAILITGHREDMADSIRKLLDQGVEAVCYKPFDPLRLLMTIHSLARPRK